MKRRPPKHNHSISALVSKRGELMGNIEALHNQIKSIKADIEALDKTILLFDPTFNLAEVKSRRTHKMNSFFRHGQMSTKLRLGDRKQPNYDDGAAILAIYRKELKKH